MTAIVRQRTITGDQLAVFFASKARVAVLQAVLVDPKRAYYQRQLGAATGLPIRAVQRELDRLTASELLYRRVEGNRAYYQVDMDHPLFPELRGMILKTLDELGRFRGHLAMDEHVRLAIHCESEKRVLVVRSKRKGPPLAAPSGYQLELMKGVEFETRLETDVDSLRPCLEHGADLLGRRGDILWQRIEAAGFTVTKGKGVP